MKAKVKSLDDYKAKTVDNDCFWLLKQIKAITLQFDEKRNGFISLLDTRTSFLTCRQQQWQTADTYLETQKGWTDTIEYHGGTFAENHELVPMAADDGTICSKHRVSLKSHLQCIHEIARKYRICPGVDINKEIIPSKAMVKFKTEFEKWKSGMKKARSEC